MHGKRPCLGWKLNKVVLSVNITYEFLDSVIINQKSLLIVKVEKFIKILEIKNKYFSKLYQIPVWVLVLKYRDRLDNSTFLHQFLGIFRRLICFWHYFFAMKSLSFSSFHVRLMLWRTLLKKLYYESYCQLCVHFVSVCLKIKNGHPLWSLTYLIWSIPLLSVWSLSHLSVCLISLSFPPIFLLVCLFFALNEKV